MPEYVDGFVLPLPKAKVEAYRAIAEKASKIWLDHGALEYRECVGDDLAVEFGTSFPTRLNATSEETVVFAWIVYESREHRDEVNAKVMKDPRMAEAGGPDEMPFDCSRMLYGGFRTIVACGKDT